MDIDESPARALLERDEGNNGFSSSSRSAIKSNNKNSKKRYKYICGTHFIQNNHYDRDFKDFIEEQTKYIYGYETCPTTDKKHLQFYFQTKNKFGIRLQTLYELHPKTHFEICNGTEEDNFIYCSKNGSYTTNIIETYIPNLSPDKLYPWENEIINIILSKPDERTIYWYWEPTGNTGKTTFSKFLSFYYKAIPLEGKKNDILYCAACFPSLIYIYDIERSLEDHLSYGAIEKIKNGYFMCAKYESKPIIRSNPHVICFANFPPNNMKLSNDRWKITELS